MIGIDQQIEPVRNADRTYHLQTSADRRHIANGAIDRAAMIRIGDMRRLEGAVPWRAAFLVYRVLHRAGWMRTLKTLYMIKLARAVGWRSAFALRALVGAAVASAKMTANQKPSGAIIARRAACRLPTWATGRGRQVR